MVGMHRGLISAMAQLDFPQFDGSNPKKMWQSRCETFFDLY